jgi:hypothetical protein
LRSSGGGGGEGESRTDNYFERRSLAFAATKERSLVGLLLLQEAFD